MGRQFKELVVNEADHNIRYNLVNREGQIVVPDVRLTLSSGILQEGDIFSAAAANILLEIADGGEPVLKIDAGSGSLKLKRQKSGQTMPASLEHGELYIDAAGNIYGAAENGKLVKADSTAVSKAAEAAKTAAAAASAAAAARTVADRAMPKSGGTFSGVITAARGGVGAYYARNTYFRNVASWPGSQGEGDILAVYG